MYLNCLLPPVLELNNYQERVKQYSPARHNVHHVELLRMFVKILFISDSDSTTTMNANIFLVILSLSNKQIWFKLTVQNSAQSLFILSEKGGPGQRSVSEYFRYTKWEIIGSCGAVLLKFDYAEPEEHVWCSLTNMSWINLKCSKTLCILHTQQ